MATYRVTDPATGRTVKLTGDSPPTERELEEIFSSLGPAPAKPSVASQAWDALKIPQQVAQQVFVPGSPMSTPEPQVSPSVLKTLVSGTPRVMEETGRDIGQFLQKISPNVPQGPAAATAEKAIAGFIPGIVSRDAMVTGGALKAVKTAAPMVSKLRKGVFDQAEQLSGIGFKSPGALEAAYRDSSLIFGKGTKDARKIYEASKEVAGSIRPQLLKQENKLKFVKKAAELSKEKTLTPIEALEARKELDGIKKQVTGTFFRETREVLDKAAKKAFEAADAAYKRGAQAESLRQFFPQNKYGGASAFKLGIMAALNKFAPGAGTVASATMVPIVQGAAATAAGVGAKAVAPVVANPAKTVAAAEAVKSIVKTLTEEKAKEFLRKAKGDKEKARKMAQSEGWQIPE